jgi:hypothetical protein
VIRGLNQRTAPRPVFPARGAESLSWTRSIRRWRSEQASPEGNSVVSDIDFLGIQHAGLALNDRAVARASEGRVRDWSDERIAKAADLLLGYMLFRDEQPLKGRVTGTSSFAEEFPRQGSRDRKGRSLRELDLNTRLFVYPCSYLIYSSTFDGLPLEMKEVIWRRLDQILAGHDGSALFRGMPRADREAVRDILLDTKPEFRRWVKRHPRQSSFTTRGDRAFGRTGSAH